MLKQQAASRVSWRPGAFAYDYLKIRVKEALWLTPPPIDRFVSTLLEPAGLMNRSCAVYLKLGRPAAVMSGPFEGMQYVPVATGAEFFPKVAGTYEKELYEVMRTLLGRSHDVVIDIGSAEGYYAIGLASRLKPVKVVCYDANPHAKRLLLRNARKNGVDHLMDCRGWCTTQSLEEELSHAANALVISDCEGAETELICPLRVPSLCKATMLVEVHEPQTGKRALAEDIEERFQTTHDLYILKARERAPADLPPKLKSLGADALNAISEFRKEGAEWLFMTPRVNP